MHVQFAHAAASPSPMPDPGVVQKYLASITDGTPDEVDGYLRNFPALLENKDSPTGATGIVLAAVGGSLDKVKVFHRHGANLNASDNGDQSAIFYAGHYGWPDVAEYLIGQGVDALAKNRAGISAADAARASDLLSFSGQLGRMTEAHRIAVQKTWVENARQIGEDMLKGLPGDITAPAKASFRIRERRDSL